MNNFEFHNSTKVIFGKESELGVGKECKKYSSRVLLHYGGGSIIKSGLYDRVVQSLLEEDIEIFELGGVEPNPRVSLVRKGIDMCQREKIGLILAVGGGSVIDSAKAIGIGYFYDGDIWDIFEYKAQATDMLPLGTVLTIPAAGSETSTGSVITNKDGDFKRPYGHPCMRPKFSILNPELTYTLPNYQTSCGISDMLAHVMERYFVAVTNVDLTDRLAEATMKTIITQAYNVFNNPKDYNARAEIMWCGTVAHNDLLSTGRGGDWSSHELEHELSGITDVAHGAGLSIIFPAWMKHVYKTNIGKFVQFATRVFNVEQDFENQERTALNGIRALENFYKDLKLPIRLSDIGFDSSRIDEMAEKASFFGKRELGNFKILNIEDMKSIYNLALG